MSASSNASGAAERWARSHSCVKAFSSSRRVTAPVRKSILTALRIVSDSIFNR